MNKKKFILVILLTIFVLFDSTTVWAADKTKRSQSDFSALSELNPDDYPDASLTGAIDKYKKSDFTGCIQELNCYLLNAPDDAVAYYYIAMSYTNIGASKSASEAYQKVIDLTNDPKLAEYAAIGKDCLTDGPKCTAEKSVSKDNKNSKKGSKKGKNGKAGTSNSTENTIDDKEKLENFINESYGNGLSPELEKQIKQGTLKRIQESINKKDVLENNDIQRIKNFDATNSSEIEIAEKIAQAAPTDKEISDAIKTLRNAGINVSINTSADTVSNTQPLNKINENNMRNIPDQQTYEDNTLNMINGYTDPQMAQISFMLGNNNNNGMMNMLPFLIQQNQSGQNIDPQLMQAVMLQQMLPSMDFGLNNNKD